VQLAAFLLIRSEIKLAKSWYITIQVLINDMSSETGWVLIYSKSSESSETGKVLIYEK
jgi:hypothetical protein